MLGRKAVWELSTHKSFEETSRVRSNLSKPDAQSWKSRYFVRAFFLEAFAPEITKSWTTSGISECYLVISSQTTWNSQIEFVFRTCKIFETSYSWFSSKAMWSLILRWYLDWHIRKIEA
jgi:hypothetical protein